MSYSRNHFRPKPSIINWCNRLHVNILLENIITWFSEQDLVNKFGKCSNTWISRADLLHARYFYGRLFSHNIRSLKKLSFSGRTHNFLSEPKSSWLLLIPSGYWSFNLYVEGQCDIEGGCSKHNTGLEFLVCISFHEFSSQPQEKSSRTLPSILAVCICGFSYHRHWLTHQN